MSLPGLARDIITLVKPDGTVIENIQANVQSKIIFIGDAKLPLEENDKIYRKLPNGLVETYIVLDRGYFSGFGGHYQAKVRKEGSIKEDKYQSIITVYTASGPNSRININSSDNSTNYINNLDSLFNDLKIVLESLPDKEIQEKSLQILEELKKSKDTPSYLIKYQEFVSLLANHMTVIAPFIPALTQLIK
jgi:hypothetical protein